jgi:hypothetical protein
MSSVVFPNGGRSVVEQMCAKFPDLHVNDDAKQRELTKRCQQQFAYQWGNRWGGKKRAGGGDPSKDSMAYLEPSGNCSTWDMFQGNSAATILVHDGAPPDFPDMPPTDAEFIPATARDWLGVPVTAPPDAAGSGGGSDSAQLDEIQSQMAQDQGQLVALDNFNTDRILQRIDDVKNQMEESLKKVLAIYLAMNKPEGGRPEEPPPVGEGDGLSELQKLVLKALIENRPQTAKESH